MYQLCRIIKKIIQRVVLVIKIEHFPKHMISREFIYCTHFEIILHSGEEEGV